MDKLETVELQLSELEMLESIYPNENEVVVNDIANLSIMKRYVETNGDSFPPNKKLPINLNLKLEELDSTLNIVSSLPADYPILSLPDVFLRCDKMARNLQQKFNEDLAAYMTTIELGETCLYQISQWAVDNAGIYITTNANKEDESTSGKAKSEQKCDTYTRLWIYSHHIYNKDKRKSILEWAKELNLTGFSMPGKPGIVCVEGSQEECEEYWQRLRRQTWKRLSVVHRADCLASSVENFEQFQKFSDPVSEMDFGVHGGRDYHMDLGKFFDFLTQHNCREIFPLLFGVKGKSSLKS